MDITKAMLLTGISAVYRQARQAHANPTDRSHRPFVSHELGFNVLKDLVMFVMASSTGNLSIEEAP